MHKTRSLTGSDSPLSECSVQGFTCASGKRSGTRFKRMPCSSKRLQPRKHQRKCLRSNQSLVLRCVSIAVKIAVCNAHKRCVIGSRGKNPFQVGGLVASRPFDQYSLSSSMLLHQLARKRQHVPIPLNIATLLQPSLPLVNQNLRDLRIQGLNTSPLVCESAFLLCLWGVR